MGKYHRECIKDWNGCKERHNENIIEAHCVSWKVYNATREMFISKSGRSE
jgi:hypothetical protein